MLFTKASLIVLVLAYCSILAECSFDQAFEEYIRKHYPKNMPSPSRRKRMLISTTRGTIGLGNRMLAHASALALAMMYDYSFHVHSPDVDLEEIFSLPDLRMIIKPEQFKKLFKRNRYNGTVLHLDTSHDARDSDWEQITCGDGKFTADAVIVNGGQYFVPLLVLKDELFFRRTFLDLSMVYALIAKRLFQPSLSVTALIPENKHILGIQLRSFKHRYDPDQDRQVLKCLESKSLIANDNGSVFVASLYPEHSEALKTRLKGATIKTISSFKRQSNTVEQYKYALAEMYTLAYSDTLLVSPYSTFGYQAVALKSSPKDTYSLDVRLACRQVDTVEPCFHRAPTKLSCVDMKKMKSTMFAPCPDYPKRGIRLRN